MRGLGLHVAEEIHPRHLNGRLRRAVVPDAQDQLVRFAAVILRDMEERDNARPVHVQHHGLRFGRQLGELRVLVVRPMAERQSALRAAANARELLPVFFRAGSGGGHGDRNGEATNHRSHDAERVLNHDVRSFVVSSVAVGANSRTDTHWQRSRSPIAAGDHRGSEQ
jgi:hypothetical protein